MTHHDASVEGVPAFERVKESDLSGFALTVRAHPVAPECQSAARSSLNPAVRKREGSARMGRLCQETTQGITFAHAEHDIA